MRGFQFLNCCFPLWWLDVPVKGTCPQRKDRTAHTGCLCLPIHDVYSSLNKRKDRKLKRVRKGKYLTLMNLASYKDAAHLDVKDTVYIGLSLFVGGVGKWPFSSFSVPL